MVYIVNITAESCDYAPPPPFVHASIEQNRGGGLCAGLHVTTTTDQRMPRGARAISALSLAV